MVPMLAILTLLIFKCRPILKTEERFLQARSFVSSRPWLGLVSVKTRLHTVMSKRYRWWSTQLRLLLLLSGDVELNPGPSTSIFDTVSDAPYGPSSLRQHSVPQRSQVECPSISTQLSHDRGSQSSFNYVLERDTTPTPSPLTPPRCSRCHAINKRKRVIECASCNRHWHLSCVRLSRAQADALSSWDCPECSSGIVPTPSSSSLDGQSCQISPASQHNEADVDEVDAIHLTSTLASLRRTRPVIRRVPRGARLVVAEALTAVMKRALNFNNVSAWIILLVFPYAALSLPRNAEADDDCTLTTKVKRQTSLFMEMTETMKVTALLEVMTSEADLGRSGGNHTFRDGPLAARSRSAAPYKRKVTSSTQTTMERLKKTVSLKLADGDVKGAIRLLSSSNEIARDSPEVTTKLKAKHPAPPANLQMPPSPDGSERWKATDSDVLAAIASFNTGSAGGLDGLRPAHIKDLISRSSGEAGIRLITELTRLVNLAIQG